MMTRWGSLRPAPLRPEATRNLTCKDRGRRSHPRTRPDHTSARTRDPLKTRAGPAPSPPHRAPARPDRPGPPRPSYRADPASRAAQSLRPLGGPGRAGRGRESAGQGEAEARAAAEAGAGNRRADAPAATLSVSSREIERSRAVSQSSAPARGRYAAAARKRGTQASVLAQNALGGPSLYGLARESKSLVRLRAR